MGFQIWPIDAILHNFQGKSKRAPICMPPRVATISVCEHVLRDAYGKKNTIIKVGETYAMSVKTKQSGFANETIRFCHQNHQNRNIRFIESEPLDF
jgi:hypothetical protein